jgi:hypothetical protein
MEKSPEVTQMATRPESSLDYIFKWAKRIGISAVVMGGVLGVANLVNAKLSQEAGNPWVAGFNLENIGLALTAIKAGVITYAAAVIADLATTPRSQR